MSTIAMLGSLDHFRGPEFSEYVRFAAASARLLVAARVEGPYRESLIACMQPELRWGLEQADLPVPETSLRASLPQEIVMRLQSLLGRDLGIDCGEWRPSRGSTSGTTSEQQSAILLADIVRSIYTELAASAGEG